MQIKIFCKLYYILIPKNHLSFLNTILKLNLQVFCSLCYHMFIISSYRVLDVLWCSMMFYDFLWCYMMFYDFLLMLFYYVLWCSMIFYGVIWCSMMFYDLLWSSMIFMIFMMFYALRAFLVSFYWSVPLEFLRSLFTISNIKGSLVDYKKYRDISLFICLNRIYYAFGEISNVWTYFSWMFAIHFWV